MAPRDSRRPGVGRCAIFTPNPEYVAPRRVSTRDFTVTTKRLRSGQLLLTRTRDGCAMAWLAHCVETKLCRAIFVFIWLKR